MSGRRVPYRPPDPCKSEGRSQRRRPHVSPRPSGRRPADHPTPRTCPHYRGGRASPVPRSRRRFRPRLRKLRRRHGCGATATAKTMTAAPRSHGCHRAALRSLRPPTPLLLPHKTIQRPSQRSAGAPGAAPRRPRRLSPRPRRRNRPQRRNRPRRRNRSSSPFRLLRSQRPRSPANSCRNEAGGAGCTS